MDMPKIGYGTYRLKAAMTQHWVEKAIEYNYRLIDTATLYRNQTAVGAAIRACGLARANLFVTSKIPVKALRKKQIEAAINQCLNELGCEYIDLLLLHAPNREHLSHDWELFCELSLNRPFKGMIKQIGVSNYLEKDIRQISSVGLLPFANQIEITPFLPRLELAKYCANNGICIQAHTSLTNGQMLNAPELKEVMMGQELSPAQALLAWALSKKISVVPHTTDLIHLQENYHAIHLDLDNNLVDKIDSISSRYAAHPQHISLPKN